MSEGLTYQVFRAADGALMIGPFSADEWRAIRVQHVASLELESLIASLWPRLCGQHQEALRALRAANLDVLALFDKHPIPSEKLLQELEAYAAG